MVNLIVCWALKLQNKLLRMDPNHRACFTLSRNKQQHPSNLKAVPWQPPLMP